jgi:glycerophosphoryl diester phosphodiesterase
MQKALFTVILATLFVLSSFSQVITKPIISAQNFSNKNEFWESVGKGIFNFQADAMYIYGKIYVTSLMPDSAKHQLPTLTDAYLYPIFNQFKKNNGEIIPGYNGDIFLILNISSQPIQVYKQLAAEMRPFTDILTFELDGVKHPGKLRILIKDRNQLDQINRIKPSFLGLAGTSADIGKNTDSNKMPLIEVDFDEITSWKGIGNIPFEDFVKFKELVKKVHGQNKKISIRNCPSNKAVADVIQKSKADFINTPEAFKMAGFFEASK